MTGVELASPSAASYLDPTGVEIAFVLLGIVTLGSALLVVTTDQLVHAALWLVLSFGGLAGCYLLLSAELVAWVQVLIYVGAVVVLLLFGIMLTRAPIGRSADLDSGNRIAALLIAVGTAATLVTVLLAGLRTAYVDLGKDPTGGSAHTLGDSIFRQWVLPFEVLSVLLLAALVGAIVLSRTNVGRVRPPEAEAEAKGEAGPESESEAEPEAEAAGPGRH